MLLEHLDPARIACVVLASIRQQPATLVADVQRRGIRILTQPRRSSTEYAVFTRAFAELGPDLILCNSYSMKLGADLLGIVGGNAINAHAALLPRNRGPNPIQWAIIHGERVTGVTLHYMTDDIDAGDIVAQAEVRIAPDDTWVSVRDNVNQTLRALIAAQLPRILEATNGRTPQDQDRATVNSRLTPDSPRIDFATMTDAAIYNLVRAQVHPLAGAYIDLGGERRRFQHLLPMDEIARLRAQYA